MHDPAKEAHKRWLKTESGRIYKAKNHRYKKAALSLMQLEYIKDELEQISEECYEYEYSIMDDEALVDAFDGDKEDLYEIKFMFSDLAARCDKLSEILYNENVSKHFNDLFVGIMGNKYKVVGYDSYEEDYFSLTGYETEWAQNESAKRLMRLSKETLLSVCGQCFGVAVSLIDLRHEFNCLTSALELLRGNRVMLLKNIKSVEEAYEAAEQRNFSFSSDAARHFDDLLWRLPDKVWIG